MRFNRREVALGAASLVTGAAVAPLAFAAPRTRAESPKRLVLEEFFRGRLTAEGMFTNTRDGSTRGLKVAMRGDWDEATQTLTLVEDFVYSDGEKDRKTWRFRGLADGRYTGTREDVVGEADVRQEGEGVRLTYSARVATAAGSNWTIRFNDYLAHVGPREVLNTADLSWLFFDVGKVKLNIRKLA